MVARGEVPVMVQPGGVGSRTVKYEAEALALGDRGYIDDIRIPGMLHAALHLTSHARAKILNISTKRALESSGVRAVFTASDIPGETYVGII
jgi:CO/xanthine dehydrogenase Mo-binding subunit